LDLRNLSNYSILGASFLNSEKKINFLVRKQELLLSYDKPLMYSKVIAMKNKNSFLALTLSLLVYGIPASANVGAIAGSNIFSISAGSASSPTYKIVSASSVGDAVYSGVVDTVVDSDTLSFATSTDEDNNTANPFYAAGAFNKDAQVPELTASVSGGAVTGVSVSYGSDGYQSSRTGFTNAPQILISSGGDGNDSVATATISSGEITSISVSNGGSGYSSAPEAIVIGGPHLLRITDTSSTHYGRVFLITNNTTTTLDLDFSILADGETGSTSTFFSAGTSVEIVRAATLGNIFGISSGSLPTNWTTSSLLYDTSSSDWVYIWDPSLGGYGAYHFVNGTSRLADGWYGTTTGVLPKNNLVIYPDEAFIVAKRTSGNVELEVEGSISTETQKLLLPETNDQMLCNNPYGMELFLAELIPSTAIGSGNTKFRPGTSDDGSIDYVTILSGATWKRYWYTSSSTNSAVTAMMKAGSRAGTGGSNAIQSSDLLISSAAITNLVSCSDAAGSSVVGNYNDGNYTKISTSGTAPGVGFTVTISNLQGYMLNDAGTHEVNATTGEDVDTNGTGSVVYSNISGSYEVVGSGSGYFVVEKQRDVNFKNEGSPTWSSGTSGTGYTTTARWWAIGGGGSGAYGTVNSSGSSFTVTAGGSGYTSSPQIVISGGGWRLSGGDSSPRGNDSIGASDGLIVTRRASGGVQAFIEPLNPSN
jgi:hypothetical protein